MQRSQIVLIVLLSIFHQEWKNVCPDPLQKDGQLGYCWMHHFKCHSARTCYTWAAGGPITEDKVSKNGRRKTYGKIRKLEQAVIDAACNENAKRKYNMDILKTKLKDAEKSQTNEDLEATMKEKENLEKV